MPGRHPPWLDFASILQLLVGTREPRSQLAIVSNGLAGIRSVHNSHSLGVPIRVPARVVLFPWSVSSSLFRASWEMTTTVHQRRFCRVPTSGTAVCPGLTCTCDPGGFGDESPATSPGTVSACALGHPWT